MLSSISGMNSYYSVYRYNSVYRNLSGRAAQGTQQAVSTVAVQQTTPPASRAPVQPVRPVPAVAPGEEGTITTGLFIRQGVDPVEFAVRMNIQYEEPTLPGQTAAEELPGMKSPQEASEEGECQTCEQRKYQDGSDDMGVSFKTPTRVAPENALAAVRGHEMEHVFREQAKAEREDREVVSQNVVLHTAICPECGKAYISGGTTTTVTAGKSDNAGTQQQAQPERRPFSAVA